MANNDFVTLLQVTATKDENNLAFKTPHVFTVELYSETAEQAYFKERGYQKLFEGKNVDKVELIGTYKKINLKVVGE